MVNLIFVASNPELGEYNGSVGSCPWVLHVFFSCFPGFSLVLDPRGRLGGLEGKVGSACEEFHDSEGGIFGYCF